MTKNDIAAWPFAQCASLDTEQLAEWATGMGLTTHNSWMLPQIAAYYGGLTVTRTAEGQLDPVALVRQFRDNDWALGLWRVCTKMRRSSLVRTQTAETGVNSCALVPLVLAGIKRYQGYSYSEWSRTGLEYVVDAPLLAAMTCVPPVITAARTLELRALGLQTKSGPKQGQLKPAMTTWTLTGLKHTEWGTLPALALTMLSQVWCAHPAVRTDSMVLDPDNWDTMPPPLIDTDVLAATTRTVAAASDVPW